MIAWMMLAGIPVRAEFVHELASLVDEPTGRSTKQLPRVEQSSRSRSRMRRIVRAC